MPCRAAAAGSQYPGATLEACSKGSERCVSLWVRGSRLSGTRGLRPALVRLISLHQRPGSWSISKIWTACPAPGRHGLLALRYLQARPAIILPARHASAALHPINIRISRRRCSIAQRRPPKSPQTPTTLKERSCIIYPSHSLRPACTQFDARTQLARQFLVRTFRRHAGSSSECTDSLASRIGYDSLSAQLIIYGAHARAPAIGVKVVLQDH